MTTTSTDTTRAEYTAGLRALADLLDDNPDAKLPYEGHKGAPMAVFVDTADAGRAWLSILPEPIVTRVDSPTFPVEIRGTLAGLHIRVYVAAGVAMLPAPVPDPAPPLAPWLTSHIVNATASRRTPQRAPQ